MRKNITQSGSLDTDGRRQINGDWFSAGIPSNVKVADSAYIDSSYGFACCHSLLEVGVTIGNSTGLYDRTSFAIGLNASMNIGAFSILNGCNFICNQYIEIGDYCMISWGTYICDTWLVDENASPEKRGDILIRAASSMERNIDPYGAHSSPVIIEDGAWIGFGSVILPGVTIGKYAVVGCKSVVDTNVPDYAVVAGNPAKIIKYLNPTF
jgi:acetyltransferase-like isoleucine patch superfamily enzyme